jgi:hypothetical protein
MKECLQPRKLSPLGSRFSGESREADLIWYLGKADDAGEETGKCNLRYRRGREPSIRGKIRRDNVGKIPLAAGAGRNLQRLLERGDS